MNQRILQWVTGPWLAFLNLVSVFLWQRRLQGLMFSVLFVESCESKTWSVWVLTSTLPLLRSRKLKIERSITLKYSKFPIVTYYKHVFQILWFLVWEYEIFHNQTSKLKLLPDVQKCMNMINQLKIIFPAKPVLNTVNAMLIL